MTTFRQDIRLGKKVPLMKTDDYDDKSVTTEKLADLSVTTEKLHDEAVTERTIAENAVHSSNIAAGAVETINIAEGAVTEKELDDNAVTTSKVEDGCITNAKLARNSVQSWNIGAQAIDSTQIRLGGIESQNLADGAVTTDKIADKAVTSAKLGDESVLISKIAQEVWDKIQDEYLRRDGKNSMKSDASIGFGDIDSVTLSKDGMSFLDGIVEVTKKGLSFDHDESSYSSYGDKVILFETADYEGSVNVVLFKVNNGNVFARDTVSAKGFLTNDRTNIGLLANDGTVGLALTDSDIDGITSSVFTNYDNVTE